MTEFERDLRESLSDEDGDRAFLAHCALVAGAAPLSEPGDVALPHADVERLITLGQEALRLRRNLAPPVQIGARGRVAAVIDRDDRNRLVALIEFDDEDALRQVGALIAGNVSIEPLIETPTAANEETPGQGSLQGEPKP